MLEKLYQDVWAHVFAATWADLREAARIGEINPVMQGVTARSEADKAAEEAIKAWNPAKAHEVVCGAQGRVPTASEEWGPDGADQEGT